MVRMAGKSHQKNQLQLWLALRLRRSSALRLSDLSIFDPTSPTGLSVAGQGVANIYQKFWSDLSPRIGFAYQLGSSGNTVLRGGYGFYYDSIYMKSVLQNNGAQNISVFGPGLNPAGSNQVVNARGLNQVIKPGVDIFSPLVLRISPLLHQAASASPPLTRTSDPPLRRCGI